MMNMSKEEITLIILFYSLMVLITCMRPFLNHISSYTWFQDLAIQWQEPVIPGGPLKTTGVAPNPPVKAAPQRVSRQKHFCRVKKVKRENVFNQSFAS
jgi:hypothetical protein